MLDSDVAMLYQYTTKRINETVRRNINRFPEKFCFQLTENEIDNLRSQIATASKVFENKFRNKKFLPYAFTEQGIAMLSGLLKKEIADKLTLDEYKKYRVIQDPNYISDFDKLVIETKNLNNA